MHSFLKYYYYLQQLGHVAPDALHLGCWKRDVGRVAAHRHDVRSVISCDTPPQAKTTVHQGLGMFAPCFDVLKAAAFSAAGHRNEAVFICRTSSQAAPVHVADEVGALCALDGVAAQRHRCRVPKPQH